MVAEEEGAEGRDEEDVEEVRREVFEPSLRVHGVYLAIGTRRRVLNLVRLSLSLLQSAISRNGRHCNRSRSWEV